MDFKKLLFTTLSGTVLVVALVASYVTMPQQQLSKVCGTVEGVMATKKLPVAQIFISGAGGKVEIPTSLLRRIEVGRLFIFEYDKGGNLIAFGPVDKCD